MALTQVEKNVLGNLIQPIVNSKQSNATNLMLLRGCKMDPDAIRIYLDKRAYWLNYDSVTQRRWQRATKNKNKVKHHDSLVLREKYVRCVNDFYDMPAYYGK